MDYLGVIVAQSLRDGREVEQFHILATRPGKSWTFHLVAIPEQEFAGKIRFLQENMVMDDCWYAHFFRGNELVVVFRDALFHMTADPDTWGRAVEHGRCGGIAPEQLDFKPRTWADAQAFFGLRP